MTCSADEQHVQALFHRCSPSDFTTTADLNAMKGMSVRCTISVGSQKADTFITGGSKSFRWEVAECEDLKDAKCTNIVKDSALNCSTHLECQNYILGLNPQVTKVCPVVNMKFQSSTVAKNLNDMHLT